MRHTFINIVTATFLAAVMFSSCQQPGVNSTGSEYMPDMGHSIAYEANHYNYYSYNTWGSEDEYYKYAKPRVPVKGTVPRKKSNGFAIPEHGSSPYHYGDTEEERTRAIAELIDNPYPITETGLAKGKEMYDIFCGTCHGDKGDGNGYLVRDDGGMYPVQPANFLMDEHVNASNGRYYHAIMYGKNLMGSYTDKISTEERWQVIHYIRSLQAKAKKLEYNQFSNTLNTVDRPAGEIKVATDAKGHDHKEGYSHDHANDHDGHDHDDHGGH